MFSDRKETFILEYSKFVVVVVYREKWKKARGQARKYVDKLFINKEDKKVKSMKSA
jgi:hypothetical protein